MYCLLASIRRTVSEKKVAEKDKQAQLAVQRRVVAATTIQALVRGVQGRVKYFKTLPALKKAKAARGFCVECESKVARRRCKECRDNFCETCFDKMHKKGRRKEHHWEAIVASSGRDSTQESRAASRGPGDRSGASKGVRWEEYWDESAQANYWSNVDTGEATWIKPVGFKG